MNTDDQLPNPTIVADESTVMPRSMRVTAGLYVVATPIGNMADISERARHTLAAVDIVAAEDTRRTGRMLTQLGIRAELISCHEHNEMQRAEQFVAEVRKGRSVALVSDAGTPLMSDPGYRLVKAMRDAGLPVTPVPGSCAAIAALSVAGLPSDRFRFEGFLPAAQKARQSRLQALASATETLIFYAGVHKVETVLADCRAAFGADRAAVLGRELTKLYETFYSGTLGELAGLLAADPGSGKGEFTLVIAGAAAPESAATAEIRRVLEVLLAELPAAQAASLAARLLGVKKRAAYEVALSIKGQGNSLAE
jgi:16S rRNA (cytidine1402-2'-O)-methyltransferase